MSTWTRQVLWFILILIVEAFALYYVKYASIEPTSTKYIYLGISMALYALTIWCLYRLLSLGQNVSSINILWDICSIIYGTFIGVVIFGESLTNLQVIGTLLGMMSIVMITIDEK